MVDRRQRVALACALFLILSSLYFLTYAGVHISNDERFIFDSTESFVRRGDFRLTYLFDLRPKTDANDGAPWPQAAQEPLQPVLAAPLFLIAENMPHIGLMHTVWLFNVFITALTGVLVYIAGLLQGYRPMIAWTGGVLFGVATMAWPYSRTFFREPLMMLFTLVAFVAAWQAQKTWQRGHLPWREGVFLLVSFGGAFLTKAVSLVLLPGLALVLFPPLLMFSTPRQRRHLLTGFGLIFLLVLVALVVVRSVGSDRFHLREWTRNLDEFQWRYVFESLIGYQISPARSIWLFSPVLLLGLWGAVLLIRRGEWRLIAGVTLGFLTLSTSYGVTLFVEWWGGHSWGPRYLLPFVPVLMLWVLPVLESLFTAGSPIYKRVFVGVLGMFSIGVQLLAVWTSVPDYYRHLGENKVVVWGEGLWSIKWSPLVQHAELLKIKAPDVAWHFSLHPVWLVIACLMVAIIVASLWVVQLLRRQLPSFKYSDWLAGIGVMLLLSLAVMLGLYQLRDDPRYTLNNPDAMRLVETLNGQVRPDEAVFIEENNFQLVMMNYFKRGKLVVSLPFAPGESFNPGIVEVYAALPLEQQLGKGTPVALDWAADHYPGLWVVLGKNFAIPNILRPTERYLVEHYYPLSRTRISDLAVVVRFYTLDAPAGPPAIEETFSFGDQLTLVGFDLPHGTTYPAGAIVPVSLVWTPQQKLEIDYLVSAQIAPRNARPITQQDGIPQATFGFTSRWESGQLYRDNYGLQLPTDLSPGEYDLQIIVYSYPTLVRLPVAAPHNRGPADIAILRTLIVR